MSALTQSRIYYLWFNADSGRWQLHDHGLHCGEGFQVLIDGTWTDVRIEHRSEDMDGGWYLIGASSERFPNSPSIRDLPCRR